MKQANENYENWKDRQDVDKAYKDWLEIKKEKKPYVFYEWNMKDFALFFAERVKGSPIEGGQR